ncbi:LamG-like jellyroll fold domain-containing protein, partial [Streptomyces brasiliscabiei]
LMAFIWPTLPNRGTRQTVLGRWDSLRNAGYALGINPDGHLEFWVGNGAEVDYVTSELPLLPKVWYFVAVSYDRASGRAELYQEG